MQNAIPSVRNLIESDLGTPLRKFTGILDSMPTEAKSYGDASKGEKVRETTYIKLNMKDLEIIDTVEPYNFPIVSIQIGISNKKKSKFGVFGVSVSDILDKQYSKEQLDPASPAYVPPEKRANLDSCIGKRLGMQMNDGQKDRPKPPMLFDPRATDDANPKGKDVATPCWSCYFIEGIGFIGNTISASDKAYAMLDGKTSQQFKQEATLDAVIKTDTALLAMIAAPDSAPNAFVNIALNSKQFTKDDKGVYHKV